VANRAAEEIERDDPLLVLGYGLVDDTGGPGRYRGGLAVRRVLELVAGEAQLNLRSHRNATPRTACTAACPAARPRRG
jgi:N-methylhydantoinase B